MNTMTVQQAYDNLTNILTMGLRAGMFQDFATVDAARASLEVLRNQGLPRLTVDDINNGKIVDPPVPTKTHVNGKE